MNAVFILRSESLRIAKLEFTIDSVDLFVLGRSSKCDFVVKDDSISRRHAELQVTEGQLTIRDLDSRNGMFLEGKRTKSCTAHDGDRVRFGRISFLVIEPLAENVDPGSEMDTEKCKSAHEGPSRALLSKAQGRIFDLLLEGHAEKKIASKLRLSTATVHNHVQAIYRVFRVHSRSELLALALKGPPPSS